MIKIATSGGIARNTCIRVLFEEKLGCRVLVTDAPQAAGALGAALLARSG